MTVTKNDCACPCDCPCDCDCDCDQNEISSLRQKVAEQDLALERMRAYVQLQHQEQQQQQPPPQQQAPQRQSAVRRLFGGQPPPPPTPPPPPPPPPPPFGYGSNERPVTAGHIRSESSSFQSQVGNEKLALDLKKATQQLEELEQLKRIGEGVMREQKSRDDAEIAALKAQLVRLQQQTGTAGAATTATTATDNDSDTSAAAAAAAAVVAESAAVAEMKSRFEEVASNFAAQKKKDDEQISALTRSLEEERNKQRRANDQAANFERAVSTFSGAGGGNSGGSEKRSWAHADLEARARLDREEIMLLRRKVADTEIASAAKVRDLEQRLQESRNSTVGGGSHPLLERDRADKDAKRIAELESFSRESYAELQQLHEQLNDATASSKRRAAQLAERAAENSALLKANEVQHILAIQLPLNTTHPLNTTFPFNAIYPLNTARPLNISTYPFILPTYADPKGPAAPTAGHQQFVSQQNEVLAPITSYRYWKCPL